MFGTIFERTVHIMKKEHAQCLVTQQGIGFKAECNKQYKAFINRVVQCAIDSFEESVDSMIEYGFNRFHDWVSKKLSE